MKPWIVLDGCGDWEDFATQEEAVAKATSLIETFLDDEWDESVTGIVVARVTHAISHYILGRREEMDDDQWYDAGGTDSFDELWDFRLEPL